MEWMDGLDGRSRSGQARDVGNWEALPSERVLFYNAVVQSEEEVCGVSSSPGRTGGAAGPRGPRLRVLRRPPQPVSG